jgi:hypothetical protein
MRPILYGDLHAAARRLAVMSEGDRRGAINEMIRRAHAADRWRKRSGVEHPLWGNGSLLVTAARTWPDPQGPVTELDYLMALTDVAAAIVEWRCAQAAAGLRRRGGADV